VARVLKYPIRVGYFYQSDPKTKNFSSLAGSFQAHAWNYDSTQKEIIDLARNSGLSGNKQSKIVIIPKDSSEAKRYIMSWLLSLNLIYHRKTNKLYKENLAEFLIKA
jgi:hypothetical protein